MAWYTKDCAIYKLTGDYRMSVSIDTIIKQAMVEAGINPVSQGKTEKKSSENKLANSLYELAEELENLGDIPIGVHKTASSDKSSLRELTRAYLFQHMLKNAVEDRLSIHNDENFKKTASEVCLKSKYLEAFAKKSSEKKHGLSAIVLGDKARNIRGQR